MVVGDILTFAVQPGHNVWQWQPESAVSEAEFNTCTFNATNGEIWATDSETKSFQIGSTDTMYFACEIGGHCQQGIQKVCIYERQLITVYLHASNFAHIFARRSWCSPSCRRPLRRLRPFRTRRVPTDPTTPDDTTGKLLRRRAVYPVEVPARVTFHASLLLLIDRAATGGDQCLS